MDLPRGKALIKGRWTFRLKPGFNGKAPVYKARFVAKGYSQVPGVDYTESEIYAPVVKHGSLRVLLSIATALDLELYQMDVTAAFLYGDLKEELYVQQPEGFINKEKPHMVCKLLKPLYGLKQAPRQWNLKFDSFLQRFGLTRSTSDPCIYFTSNENPSEFLALGLWVDDAIIASKSKAAALSMIVYLEQHFAMTSGPADRFLGLELTRDRQARLLHVTQSSFIKKLLVKFQMINCNTSRVPADPCSRLTNTLSSPPAPQPPSPTSYRALIGGLLYVMSMTRPDLTFAVISASRHSANPGKPHWKAARLILAYLAGTPQHGLCFSGTGSTNTLSVYSDADYNGCPDTGRSTSGTLALLNGSTVSWKSHLQKPVSQSTAESEYYATGLASRDIVWLRALLNELGFHQTQATPLMCDSRSAVHIVHNPVFHDKTKHIKAKYHYIRQVVQEGEVQMVSVPSADQYADFLTKPLAGPQFEINRSRIGVLERPLTST